MQQQWVDLARFSGLQTRKNKPPSYQTPDSPNPAALECNTAEEANIDELKNQWGDFVFYVVILIYILCFLHPFQPRYHSKSPSTLILTN